MKLGDRVKTHKFGEGTVVGFEVLGVRKAWLSSTPDEGDRLQRVVVALDNPKAWVCANERNPHPYMMYGDFEDGRDFLPPMAVPRLPKVVTPPEFKPAPMPKPTPLPELDYEAEHELYDRMAETFRIVGVRMGVLALFIFICLIYFR
jgi:hypothetical protein